MKSILNDIGWAEMKNLQGKDFLEVEDHPNAFQILSAIATLAVHNALVEAFEIGYSRIFIRNEKLIRRHVDGTEDIVLDPTLKEGGKYYYHTQTKVFYLRKK